jgi:gamma-glutamylcyclotransferase (GGCT)/AIG2-like uncharacterized protein YtfP
VSPHDSLLYFAYGSNMLTRRLQARTPSARAVGTATLSGFEMRWHMLSTDGSAKCDVVQAGASDARVHGVVFEIELAERPALDLAEGVGLGYRVQRVTVETAHGAVEAWTYRALRIDRGALPYSWYKALVVAGAREHGLPRGYVDALEAVAAQDDPQCERMAHNLLIVHGA